MAKPKSSKKKEQDVQNENVETGKTYTEHMADWESKAEKKEKAKESSEQENDLSNHRKFDKFKK